MIKKKKKTYERQALPRLPEWPERQNCDLLSLHSNGKLAQRKGGHAIYSRDEHLKPRDKHT